MRAPLLAIALLAGCATTPPTPRFTPTFEAKACAAGLPADARCGTVNVPEDWAEPGRLIGLNVIVLPAKSPTGAAPLFDLDGGPGLPDTKNVGFYLTDGARHREHRDIVSFDQRGTGGSNPLTCPGLGALEPMYPPDAVAACRDKLSETANLTRYRTEEAVQDLDAVRHALGYDRIDLFGLSYGTTLALRYIATYPDRVRAAVLMGAVPATAAPPSRHTMAARRALRLIFADCKADAACGAAFPTLDADLVKAGASEVQMERLRSLMYAPAGARQVPFVVHALGEGDAAPLMAATDRGLSSMIADGVYLSITCSESFGAFDFDAASSEARWAQPFRDYRLRRQQAACEQWPSLAPSPDFYAPVATDTPVLLIAGNLDPVTPPEWADEIARTLPNSRVLNLRHGGHIPDGLTAGDTCLEPLIARFYETADAQALDFGCASQMTPPPFRTK